MDVGEGIRSFYNVYPRLFFFTTTPLAINADTIPYLTRIISCFVVVFLAKNCYLVLKIFVYNNQ